jgi:hypothetical protein
MPRRQLQHDLADYAQRIQDDRSWTATPAEHGANLARMVDAYIVATDLYRELAAVRGAANRTIDGLQAENQTLRTRLAARETAVTA